MPQTIIYDQACFPLSTNFSRSVNMTFIPRSKEKKLLRNLADKYGFDYDELLEIRKAIESTLHADKTLPLDLQYGIVRLIQVTVNDAEAKKISDSAIAAMIISYDDKLRKMAWLYSGKNKTWFESNYQTAIIGFYSALIKYKFANMEKGIVGTVAPLNNYLLLKANGRIIDTLRKEAYRARNGRENFPETKIIAVLSAVKNTRNGNVDDRFLELVSGIDPYDVVDQQVFSNLKLNKDALSKAISELAEIGGGYAKRGLSPKDIRVTALYYGLEEFLSEKDLEFRTQKLNQGNCENLTLTQIMELYGSTKGMGSQIIRKVHERLAQHMERDAVHLPL